MGILRCLLALLVVVDHLRAFPHSVALPLYGGVIAVKMFFAISGFYMALVLDGRYRSVGTFYLNRVVRLAPVYFAVVILTAVLLPTIVTGEFAYYLPKKVRDYILTFTVVGLDVTTYTCWKGGFSFCAEGTPVFSYVSQMWSVGIELQLYVLAPLLVRSRKALIVAIVISLGFFVALILAGQFKEPWNRMVTIGQMLYFCLGIVAYRLFVVLQAIELPRYTGPLTLAAAITVALHEAIWAPFHQPDFFGELITVCAFAALLPVIFRWTMHSRADEFVGALSYPIYVCHLLVISLISRSAFIQSPPFDGPAIRVAIYVGAILALSVLLLTLIERPAEKLRRRALA